MCDYCQWAREIVHEEEKFLSTRDELSRIEKRIAPRKPSPIIVIHGYPGDVEYSNPSALELMKKSANDGYKLLIQGGEAPDVIVSTILQLEEGWSCSSGASIKCSALADDQGRTGCVIRADDCSAILEAREQLEGSPHPLIIQDKITNKKDKTEDKNREDGVSGGWGVIVRDKNQRMICGRVSWEFSHEFPPAIPVAMIYGTGIFMRGKTCFSMTGDDESIRKIPARRMFRWMKSTDKHLTSRRQIEKLMSKVEGKRAGAVFLGSFDRAVVSCSNRFFPWVSCSRNMINYGASAGEIHSQDVDFDGEILCRCHWR